jgi:hypothetical protein
MVGDPDLWHLLRRRRLQTLGSKFVRSKAFLLFLLVGWAAAAAAKEKEKEDGSVIFRQEVWHFRWSCS